MHASPLLTAALLAAGALSFANRATVEAQSPSPHGAAATPCRLSGTVVDSQGGPVDDAVISWQSRDGSRQSQRSDRSGHFSLAALPCGNDQLRVDHTGFASRTATLTVAPGLSSPTRIVLGRTDPEAAAAPMDFADQPNFAIAGVTDWTAVGGHGSDAVLRTSEDLSRETARLTTGNAQPGSKATSPGSGETEAGLRAAVAALPGSYAAHHDLGELLLHTGRFREALPFLQTAAALPESTATDQYDLALACQSLGDLPKAHQHIQLALAKENRAAFHALAGALAESSGDPVTAVGELQRATQLDPSAEHYLAWGSELLLHRAVWQAAEVLRTGAERHPTSAPLKTAYGAALFAEAQYEAAAHELCAAVSLDPADPEAYRSLGKITVATAAPLPCTREALARFVQLRPASAESHYFYAMALLRGGDPADQERAASLLQESASLDPKYAPALLELGILAADHKDFAEAILRFQQALAADPQQAEAHYRLGVTYDRTGDPARAREQYRIHEQLEREQAAAVEQGRREIKQFQVVPEGTSANAKR